MLPWQPLFEPCSKRVAMVIYSINKAPLIVPYYPHGTVRVVWGPAHSLWRNGLVL